MKRKIKISNNSHYPYIVLLIPALREQNIVEETISHFSRMNYPHEKISIYFITTIREEIEKGRNVKKIKELNDYFIKTSKKRSKHELICEIKNKILGLLPESDIPKIFAIYAKGNQSNSLKLFSDVYYSSQSTKTLIENAIKKNNESLSMMHLECPYLDGGRATQLSWSLDHIERVYKERRISTDNIYIGTYDFDSRPDFDSLLSIPNFLSVDGITKRNWPAMFQQTQIPYDDGNNKKGEKSSNFIVSGNTVFYLKRAINKEIYKIIKKEKIDNYILPTFLKAMLRPVVYGIGAGMFVRFDKLKKIKGFTEPQEDLSIGYRMCILGETIQYIPFMNFMQPYINLRQIICGSSHSFHSALKIYDELGNMADVEPNIHLKMIEKWSLVIKEYADCLYSIVKMPFIFLSYSYLFIFWQKSPLFIFLCHILLLPIFDMIVFSVVQKRIYEDYPNKKYKIYLKDRIKTFLMIISAPIHQFIDFIFSFKGLLMFGKTKYSGIDISRKKAER